MSKVYKSLQKFTKVYVVYIVNLVNTFPCFIAVHPKCPNRGLPRIQSRHGLTRNNYYWSGTKKKACIVRDFAQYRQKHSPGNDLLFHKVALGVSSALEDLTAVFGMSTGVSPPL